MQQSVKESTCYSYALWLLSRRNYSRFKLSRKLQSKKHPKPLVLACIAELEASGLFREQFYIDEKVRAWSEKKLSDGMILRRFTYEGIQISAEDLSEIRSRLSISQTDEDEQIEDLLRNEIRKRRIISVPSDFHERRKLEDKVISVSFRKGHSVGKAREILKRLFSEIEIADRDEIS